MNNNDRHRGWWRTVAVVGTGLLVLAGVLVLLRRPHRPPPRRYDVAIQGVAFVPASLEVQQGDTVVWTNRDIVPHTATSTSKPGWDTGPLARGESGSYIADHQGEQAYACLLHPTMTGIVIVR